ncbi:MAG: putative oxidoreductase C-terminal domain-containing protein [Massilibacteroides sp.]|nr:putative oxidoreductase C-terminal domain-containing protein [Massilibacteroides sp.]MDD3063751.1 putative oxidoreductase C-terminal domain-containing protein [Massilibacteroides sp.]MDD4114748.1 putative oxidoreductase C-terminal domain-containing protein [Massilibacteroides sp.]MDD4659896.1 putative oxidoreductase C-terminal domain-containing protein [Massilibacteroides sp.]
MKKYLIASMAVLLIGTSCSQKKASVEAENVFTGKAGEVKLITLDPGHFHAALVQKTSYPQVFKDVYVYAPEGEDVQDHLKKIEAYNSRAESPTVWNEIVYTGPDFLQKMLQEKKGNVMVTAGNNGKKTEYIKQTLSAGINVLADKPMAINTANFELLKECFDIAREKGVLLYDIMTERHEITTILQREFSLLPAVYGEQQSGTPEDPAIVKESVHHFFKVVSGSPLKRPAWFFDVEQQGEGIVDVSTHLVDMIQWEAFPDEIIDYNRDIEMLDANRWSTSLSLAQFKEVTGLDGYPDYLKKALRGDTLHVYSNGDILYKIKGVHAKVLVKWNYTYPEGGGDTHFSVMKGSKANLVIRQDREQNYTPELYIEAAVTTDAAYVDNLQKEVEKLSVNYPGITLSKVKEGVWQVLIPQEYRVGHEAHFGQVMENFLQYLQEGALPDWEVPNMITKYYITTKALEIAKNK